MAAFFDALTDEHIAFVQAQPIFFVATAPMSGEGHINCSPKGLDSFRVLSPTQVGYLDLTGSGNETAAHITENGRITFMFCSFDRAPLIFRIYGQGRVVTPNDADWTDLAPHFTDMPGARQIILCDVTSVQTSCGYAVPHMELVKERHTLTKWAASKDEDEMAAYRVKKNSVSIDGLPTPTIAPA